MDEALSAVQEEREAAYARGAAEGRGAGQRQGRAEGAVAGVRQGFGLGQEMGYYLGAAQTWAQLRPGGLTTGQRRTAARIEADVNAILGMAVDDDKLQETVERVRAQFKLLCVNLKVKQPFRPEETAGALSF